jgi:hypothetical protein
MWQFPLCDSYKLSQNDIAYLEDDPTLNLDYESHTEEPMWVIDLGYNSLETIPTMFTKFIKSEFILEHNMIYYLRPEVIQFFVSEYKNHRDNGFYLELEGNPILKEKSYIEWNMDDEGVTLYPTLIILNCWIIIIASM